jgi:hypothetical protein
MLHLRFLCLLPIIRVYRLVQRFHIINLLLGRGGKDRVRRYAYKLRLPASLAVKNGLANQACHREKVVARRKNLRLARPSIFSIFFAPCPFPSIYIAFPNINPIRSFVPLALIPSLPLPSLPLSPLRPPLPSIHIMSNSQLFSDTFGPFRGYSNQAWIVTTTPAW